MCELACETVLATCALALVNSPSITQDHLDNTKYIFLNYFKHSTAELLKDFKKTSLRSFAYTI